MKLPFFSSSKPQKNSPSVEKEMSLAVRNDDVEKVREGVISGLDVFSKVDPGFPQGLLVGALARGCQKTALLLACHAEEVGMVPPRGEIKDAWIQSQRLPYLVAEGPVSILHLAVRHDHHELVSELIRRNWPLDIPDPQGMTPLFWAAYYNNHQAALKLLAAGAEEMQSLNRQGLHALLHWQEIGQKREILAAPTSRDEWLKFAPDLMRASLESRLPAVASETPVRKTRI
jgi:hypothetical protein